MGTQTKTLAEQVADCPQSYTGKFLAPLLRRDRERQAQLDAQ